MKYIIIILSITICFACSPSDKAPSKDAQNISAPSKQGSKKVADKSSKKKGKKVNSKLGRKYMDLIAQNILTEEQAMRLQEIDKNFSSQKNDLMTKNQWKGKSHNKTRVKHNRDKNNLIKSTFGEDIYQKLMAFNESRKNENPKNG